MKRRQPIALLSLSLLTISLPGCAGRSGGPGSVRYDNAAKEVHKVVKAETQEKMVKYGSNEELDQYFLALQEAQAKRDAAMYSKSGGDLGGGMMEEDSASMPAAPMEQSAAEPSSAADSADASGGESITNTQEQGVDEGGIVKVHGDHLVVLRRGRLWTAKVGDGALEPVSMLDVRPAEGHDSWYDEMLIHDDKIVVVGFSYMAGATELGLFNIDKNGKLRHEDTFFLKSNDYYSSRNYASRLLGDKLVFYMPYYLGYGWDPKNRNLPGVAKHRENQNSWGQDDWDQVIDATDIYRPVQETQYPVLHTVVTCDLDKGFRCDAQGILAPYGRTFYVSKNAVYVWVNDEYNYYDEVAPEPAIAADEEPSASGGAPLQVAKRKDIDPTSVVYRLSLDGGAPGAIRVWGSPVDQFSFKESSDGYLNVLVRSEAQGDTMWNAEFAYGDAALLRVPTQAFDSGVVTASADAFTDLPDPVGDGYAFQNRFVGDYLIYGNGSGWGYAADAQNGKVYAHPYTRSGATSSDVSQLSLPHGVDRIEAMGRDAVIVGSDGQNLHFSALDLDSRPFVAGKYVQRNATQGETRSHGFFYKPTGNDEGMLGLPIRGGSAPGYEHLMYGSASLLYLSVNDLNFSELGSLASSPEASQDDACQVSCVDWYGNARPIFLQGRVFALLGYELVEGAVSGGRTMQEVRRINLLDAQTKPKQMAR